MQTIKHCLSYRMDRRSFVEEGSEKDGNFSGLSDFEGGNPWSELNDSRDMPLNLPGYYYNYLSTPDTPALSAARTA